MQTNCLVFRDLVQLGEFRQIRAKFRTITNRNFPPSGFRQYNLWKFRKIRRQPRFHFRVCESQCIKLYEYRTISGMEIHNARNRFCFKKQKKFDDFVMDGKRNLIPKIDQKGLVAGRNKANFFYRGTLAHRRGSIARLCFQTTTTSLLSTILPVPLSPCISLAAEPSVQIWSDPATRRVLLCRLPAIAHDRRRAMSQPFCAPCSARTNAREP